LVTINAATGEVSGRTETGSVDAAINTMGYDAVTGKIYSVSNDDTDRFVAFVGTTQSQLGGVVADSVRSLTVSGGDTFASRVATVVNGFDSIDVLTSFQGSLFTAGSIGRASFAGPFSGTLSSNGSISSVSITNGAVLGGAIIESNANIGTFSQTGGAFDGRLSAYQSTSITLGNALGMDGAIEIVDDAGSVSVGGDSAGDIDLGLATRGVRIGGILKATGSVRIAQDTSGVELVNGTEAGSVVLVEGYAGSIRSGNTHRGVIGVRMGAGSLSFTTPRGNNVLSTDRGIVSVGLNTGSLSVTGTARKSVFSFGTWIGDDGILNTDDDVITGGSIGSASFGRYEDTVLAAGVLPGSGTGAFTPGVSDNRLYVGNAAAGVDSAEAGGVFRSRIGRISISDGVFNTNAGAGQRSVIAAADSYDLSTLGNLALLFTGRTYNDPLGAPVVTEVEQISNAEVRIVLSEPINSASITVSQDGDGDGLTDGLVDFDGSITVRDADGNVLNDVTVTYETRTLPDGTVQGVLSVRRAVGFDGQPQIQLKGDGDIVLYDRSGLRSALRDLDQDGVQSANEDPFGTVLDGDSNGEERGDFLIADGDGSFVDAAASDPLPVVVDDGGHTLVDTINNEDDVDVYHFAAQAGQFLSLHLRGEHPAVMGLFLLDDQGTPTTSDDTYELVARHEELTDGEIWQGFELPQTGEYFVVVGPSFGLFGPQYNAGTNTLYSLTVTLASTDDGLAVPAGETIAYVSNEAGPNNVGFNVPKQLVYLDFDGGFTTDFDEIIGVPAFDATTLSSQFTAADTNVLINGSVSQGVTGIIENVLSIFSDTPDTHPLGQLTVQLLGANLAAFMSASSGLFFTTVDPALSGLDPTVDYTTVFVGEADAPALSPFALAASSQTDVANMDKADNAIIFTQNVADQASAGTRVALLNEYSTALANLIAHELGAMFGLNETNRDTVADDSDNNAGNGIDGEAALVNLMASASDRFGAFDLTEGLWTIGTAPLFNGGLFGFGGQFPIGDADALTNLLRWLK
jgi:hypothetical protein